MPMTPTRALEILRANKDALRAKGVIHAAVFGSVARGEARPDSDIDLMIDLRAGKRFSVYDFAKLQADLSDLFARKVDLVEERALKSLVREEAMRERVNAF